MSRFSQTVVLLVLASLVPIRSAVAEQGPVAVVDLDRALRESQEGRRIMQELRVTHGRYQAELERREAELRALRVQIEQASPDQRGPLGEQYRYKYASLQELYLRYQRELASDEERHVARILRQLRQVVEVLRRERGYSVVLELNTGQRPPSGPRAADDVTNDVIVLYNERFGDGTPPPSPPSQPPRQ